MGKDFFDAMEEFDLNYALSTLTNYFFNEFCGETIETIKNYSGSRSKLVNMVSTSMFQLNMLIKFFQVFAPSITDLLPITSECAEKEH